MGYIQVHDTLNTAAAWRYVDDCRKGKFVPDAPEAGCSLNIEMTKIADALYHRTCNFLDLMENKPYYIHGSYQQVVDFRKENRSRLEFILAKATTKFSHMCNAILIEMLHQCLTEEVEVLQTLESINRDIGATAVQRNVVQPQILNHIPDQFQHQFQHQFQNSIQEQIHDPFPFPVPIPIQIEHDPIHDEYTKYISPPPGLFHGI